MKKTRTAAQSFTYASQNHHIIIYYVTNKSYGYDFCTGNKMTLMTTDEWIWRCRETSASFLLTDLIEWSPGLFPLPAGMSSSSHVHVFWCMWSVLDLTVYMKLWWHFLYKLDKSMIKHHIFLWFHISQFELIAVILKWMSFPRNGSH